MKGDNNMNASNIFFIVGIVYLINLLSIIAIVYFERKKTISAVVWILVLTILPLIGFILYFIFGKNFHLFQRKKFKNKREFDALYKSWITDEKHIFKSKNNTISAEKLEKYHDFIEMNINAGGSIYSQDNDITLFTSAKENYASLFKDIENASDTVQVFYFSINNDDIGRKFINLLAKKASDGVRIRLMYDHAGSWVSTGSMFAPLINAGGKVYSFFPLKFGTYTRYNYRNHRKIVIIDGTIAYMGGMNIGDEYLGLDKRLTPWRDTHIRLTGSAVHSVQLRFLMDWYYSAENEGKTP